MSYKEHIIEIYIIEPLRGLVDQCVTIKKNNKKTRFMSLNKLDKYIKSIKLNGYVLSPTLIMKTRYFIKQL